MSTPKPPERSLDAPIEPDVEPEAVQVEPAHIEPEQVEPEHVGPEPIEPVQVEPQPGEPEDVETEGSGPSDVPGSDTPEEASPEAGRPVPSVLRPAPVAADLTRVAPPSAEPSALLPSTLDSAREATRSRGREFFSLLVRYGKQEIPAPVPRPPAADTGPPRLVGRIGQVIPYLQTLPWLLGALFALSFFWDFPGVAFEVFGRSVPADGLIRVLSVSGLIGFLTNWVAITMLFQPRAKRAIIPQGLIPAQRERVIYQLSSAISRELINAEIIKQKIQESGVIGRYRDLALGVVRGVVENPDFRTELKGLATEFATDVLGRESFRKELARVAVEKVEEQAGQGLGGVALRLYRTFAEDDFQRRIDRALAELPQAITPLLDRIDTALDTIPPKVEARADEIEEAATKAVLSFVESFDVRAMIMEKARGFDESQLENLLKSTSNEQLNYIKYLGGILGVFGGLVIWRAETLLVFVAAGLLLWGLDEALVRARRTA
jgi:hypothetical protein